MPSILHLNNFKKYFFNVCSLFLLYSNWQCWVTVRFLFSWTPHCSWCLFQQCMDMNDLQMYCQVLGVANKTRKMSFKCCAFTARYLQHVTIALHCWRFHCSCQDEWKWFSVERATGTWRYLIMVNTWNKNNTWMKSFVMLCHFRETLRGDEGQTDLSLFDFLQFSDSDFTDKCDSSAGLAVEESHGRPLQSSFSVGTFGSQADSTVNSSLWRCLVRTFVVSPSASQQRRLDPSDDEHCF